MRAAVAWRRISIVCISLSVTILNVGVIEERVAFSQGKTELSSTALALVPEDVAFFATSIHMGRGWDDFARGAFVSQLRSVPYVQTLEREFMKEWNSKNGQIGVARGYIENPNIRNLLKLAGDMTSQEFFVYGESDWCEMIEGLVEFQTKMMATLQQDPEAMADFFNNLDRGDIDSIHIPTTVLGFRIKDKENAGMQLDALEGILRLVGGQAEQFQPFLRKLQRNDLKDGQTLTLTLDTSLIPIDDLSEEQLAAVNKVIELLEGRRIAFSMGIKSDLLLIAFGENEQLIESVGESDSKLLDHAAMDVLKQANPNELRNISFASQRWRQSQWDANFSHYFRNLSLQFSVALDVDDEEIPDAQVWKEEILRDATWVDERLGDMVPEYGDLLNWSQATPTGSEGFGYDWSENGMWENASPLQILEHAGSKSLMFVGYKGSTNPALGELIDYALDRIPEHLRRFIAAAERDPEDRELALDVLSRSWPLLERTVDILRGPIAESMESNETLVSIAAAWTTRELGPSLPPSDQPLPLPELAVTCKVDDRELFLKGCGELYAVFDEVVELVRDVSPDSIPSDYEIPRPVADESGTTTTYYYQEALDAVPLPGFKPQLSINDQVVVLGYSDRQTQDMLAAKPLATRPAWVTAQTPVAAVTYWDFGGVVSALRPWMKYGMSTAGMPPDEPLFPAPGPVPSANDVLQIWDCFSAVGKAAGTVATDEDGPTVSRWVWVSQ